MGSAGCAVHGTSAADSELPAPTDLVYLSAHPDADALCPVREQPEHFVKCCEHDQSLQDAATSDTGLLDAISEPKVDAGPDAVDASHDVAEAPDAASEAGVDAGADADAG